MTMDRANMESYVGRSIRVDRGGPQSRTGKLIAVHNDYFVVHTEDEGTLYYKNDHVKSLTVDSFVGSNDDSNGSNNGDDANTVVEYLDADDFVSLIKSMQYSSVQINRGGPEKIEGVIVDANDSEVTVVSGNEIIKLLPFHIRNISYGTNNNNQQQQNNGQNKNNSSSKSSSSRKNSRRK